MLHVVAVAYYIVQTLYWTLCIWPTWYVIFHAFFSSSDFLKIFFFKKKKFKNNIRMSNSSDPDQARQNRRAWSGSKPFAAVYPRLVEFLHFGQKSHCVNTAVMGIAMLFFLSFNQNKLLKDQNNSCLDFSSKYLFLNDSFKRNTMYPNVKQLVPWSGSKICRTWSNLILVQTVAMVISRRHW